MAGNRGEKKEVGHVPWLGWRGKEGLNHDAPDWRALVYRFEGFTAFADMGSPPLRCPFLAILWQALDIEVEERLPGPSGNEQWNEKWNAGIDHRRDVWCEEQ